MNATTIAYNRNRGRTLNKNKDGISQIIKILVKI